MVYATSGRYLIFLHGENLKKSTLFHAADGHITAIDHTPGRKGIFFAWKHVNGTSKIGYKDINNVYVFVAEGKHTISLKYSKFQYLLKFRNIDSVYPPNLV